MSKWKCDICGTEFDNFQAQGFDNKIYCPLCFYKHEFNTLNKGIDELIEKYKKEINKCDCDTCRTCQTYHKVIKKLKKLKGE